MTTKEQFLGRLKRQLQQSYVPEGSETHPGLFEGYSYNADATTDDMIRQFVMELETLGGKVYVLEEDSEAADVVLNILKQHDAERVIAWESDDLAILRKQLTEAGITIEADHLGDEAARQTRKAELDDVRVGITGAQAALADTGAMALISGEGRSRMASLMPPVHIALVRASKLYPSLPAYLADNPDATSKGSNLVFIAGPSRTGDIEMTLSMGVHGPGEVHVLVLPE